MPIISDVVYMTEQAYMVVAGAALVKGEGAAITRCRSAGPTSTSTCPLRGPSRPGRRDLIRCVRREVAKLPSPACDYYRYGADAGEPRFAPEELDGMFPSDHRRSYDTHEVLARLTDYSLFGEFLPEVGREMICGVAGFRSLAGFVANNLALTEHPDNPDVKRPGGILYREGIAKIAQFSRCCNDDGIPIVWLQDISGFDIGPEAERQDSWATGRASSTPTRRRGTDVHGPAPEGLGRRVLRDGGAPYGPVLQLATRWRASP